MGYHGASLAAKPKMGTTEQVPLQYAKPLRKTAYLQTYSHVVNGGLLYKEHEYPDMFQFNTQHDTNLSKLFENNVVSFTADRVKDVRGMGWMNDHLA
jgi:hypothetical protein